MLKFLTLLLRQCLEEVKQTVKRQRSRQPCIIYTVVLIMTEVTTEVNLKIVVIRAHEETASHVRVGNRCTRAGLHGDFEVSGTVIRAVVCCFREVGLNVDTNILSCCCYDFKGCIPVRPSCRALSLIGKVCFPSAPSHLPFLQDRHRIPLFLLPVISVFFLIQSCSFLRNCVHADSCVCICVISDCLAFVSHSSDICCFLHISRNGNLFILSLLISASL